MQEARACCEPLFFAFKDEWALNIMAQSEHAKTSFPIELARKLANASWPSANDFLYYHQNIPRIYFAERETRGLLIYHGTGMGKSILAASLAFDAMFPQSAGPQAASKPRRVVILLAKSLASNMQGSILQYINERAKISEPSSSGFGALVSMSEDERRAWVAENFSFVTMNASNMLEQMSRATLAGDDDDALIDAKARDLLEATSADLSGKLLIVDEAHNFFRAITNGTANATNLYKIIMGTRNLKIAFLTGTPMANHPFELAVCFNMVAGANIFPIQYEEFARLFIAKTDGVARMINRNKFQNRIFGLVSFVDFSSRPGVGLADLASDSTGESRERDKQHVEFPREKPMEVVRVHMDIDQYNAYLAAREHEKSEGLAKAMRGGASGAGAPTEVVGTVGTVIGARVVQILAPSGPRFRVHDTPALQKPKSAFSSTYRVHSRQISNYCAPSEIRRAVAEFTGDDKIPYATFIAKIETVSSPKFVAILEKLNGPHKNQLGIIYSQFVEMGGLRVFARFLDQNGYKDKYAIISGDIPADERQRIIDSFNARENMRAENIALLLISSTGAEGIDLKNVRHVHILEPYWNYGRILQVKARAIRNRSHIDLPPEERDVATYVYLAIPPLEAKTDEKTSDEELFDSAQEGRTLIEAFESALKEVSIECALNHPASERGKFCRLCAPTNRRLMTANILQDMEASDPCAPLVSKKIQGIEKIQVGSIVFAFKKSEPGSVSEKLFGYDVFEEDTKIRAWRHLALNDVRYSAIVETITSSHK